VYSPKIKGANLPELAGTPAKPALMGHRALTGLVNQQLTIGNRQLFYGEDCKYCQTMPVVLIGDPKPQVSVVP
jgi:hypothetical protein